MKNLFSNIKGDSFGGITAGIVALPLALAFGVSSGLGPTAGLYAMEDMLQDLKKNNVEVLFVGLLNQPRYMMERIDIIPDFIPEEHIFETFKSCVNWVKENIKDLH